MASPSERQLNAVQAAASVLFNVDVEAFGKGGIWAPVGKHVMSKGLREMYKVEAVELGLTTAVELASVNIVIAFAVELLEFVEAAAS
ncbi:hypothetical protein LMG29542_02489 [Paraburkholderia humisilvae]|uniref:Uncharacterized protein n=2 Tax=Paraburkholderia humisilvae TaxID=627669 RepID=A0A6J5DLE8_9BURK|nr:hypothetical protein LMG29542_02489 [Paraburkholderia humisilvae]